jgi:hypothetical protein
VANSYDNYNTTGEEIMNENNSLYCLSVTHYDKLKKALSAIEVLNASVPEKN